MDTFTFRTVSNGVVKKVTVKSSLELARWLVDCDYVYGGVWESITNRIYL